MDATQRQQAIDLFVIKYGKSPKECGLPAIDVFEKQHAFIYAPSEDVAKAYKTSQSIIRWLMVWGLWPMPFFMILFLVYVFPRASKNDILFDPITLCFEAFFILWGVAMFCLCIYGYFVGKKSESRVYFINYAY